MALECGNGVGVLSPTLANKALMFPRWCPVDAQCRRVLLGDAYGRLAMLAFDDDRVALTLIPIGEVSIRRFRLISHYMTEAIRQTSPATCLTYLSSQVLYLGSHYGDSQLLRIHPAPIANASRETLPIPKGVSTVPASALAPGSEKGKGRADDADDIPARDGRIVNTKGTFLEVLQAHDNIAPIMDAILADVDGSGQVRRFPTSSYVVYPHTELRVTSSSPRSSPVLVHETQVR